MNLTINNNRNYIATELNSQYIPLINERVKKLVKIESGDDNV